MSKTSSNPNMAKWWKVFKSSLNYCQKENLWDEKKVEFMPAVIASLFNVQIAEVNRLVRFLKRRTGVGRVVFIPFKLTRVCQSVIVNGME